MKKQIDMFNDLTKPFIDIQRLKAEGDYELEPLIIENEALKVSIEFSSGIKATVNFGNKEHVTARGEVVKTRGYAIGNTK